MPLKQGTTLGRYEILELIGKGAMGEVYRAQDATLGRDVAIKVLPEELARDKQRLERFKREARLLAKLNHTNIATSDRGALVWVSRDGAVRRLTKESRLFAYPGLSPDETRLVMVIRGADLGDLWFYDLDRETLERSTRRVARGCKLSRLLEASGNRASPATMRGAQ